MNSILKPPAIETLDNGLRVVLRPSADNNIVSVILFFPLPGAIERESEAGLVGFTLRLLLRGTLRLTEARLAEAIEALGSSIEFDADDEYCRVSLDCTADTLAESLDLLAEILNEPAFEPEEMEKERQSTQASIRRRDDSRMSFTMRHLMRHLYPGHSFGLPRLGLPESVGGFTREQAVNVHMEIGFPSRNLLVMVGNFDPDDARARLIRLFPARKPTLEAYAVPPAPLSAPATERLHRPGEQAILTVGYRVPGVDSPDYPALRLLSALLGESMSSRFFIHLRDEQGLAYATGSTYAPMSRVGHLIGYIGTSPGTLDRAREGMLKEFARVVAEPVPQDELDRARNYLIGRFLISHQTNHNRGFYLGHFEMLGLGMDMDERYPSILARVTPADIQSAASKVLHDPVIVELVPPQ